MRKFMNAPLITVVVAVYNIEEYLHRCVESILNQTYQNLEIILVDDGSTDRSGKICDEFCYDSRIKVIHKSNAGLGMARNSGIKTMRGEYVTFVDGDDYLEDYMIERLYHDLAEANGDTAIGGFVRVSRNKKIVVPNPLRGKALSQPDIIHKILVPMLGYAKSDDNHLEMSVWKSLFSSQIIRDCGIFFHSEREFISEDIIFDFDYYPHARRVVMSGCNGYYYCDNSGSLTTSYRADRFQMQKKLYLELVERTKRMKIYHESSQRLMSTLVSIARYSIKLEQLYAKTNGREKAWINIRKICEDDLLNNILSTHDVFGSIPSKVINYLIKKQYVVLLWIVMSLKNKFNV